MRVLPSSSPSGAASWPLKVTTWGAPVTPAKSSPPETFQDRPRSSHGCSVSGAEPGTNRSDMRHGSTFCRSEMAYKHRGALRGIPGSACRQPEPNATELPSCAPISARAAQRRRRRRWWRGEEGARRPAPEDKSCATSCGTSSTAPCAASFTCLSFMCHLRADAGGLASGSPRAAAYLLAPRFRRLKMTRATTNTFNKN